MNISRLIAVLVINTLLFSCLSKDEIVSKDDSQLAHLDSLVTLQSIGLLGERIHKTANINGTTESKAVVADSIFVQGEFKSLFSKKFERVFTNGAYLKTQSNGEYIYTRKDGENSGPLTLRLTFDSSDRLIRLIYIETKDNYIYQTENKGVFELNPNTGLITNYELSGFQKIIGLDKNEYKVTGVVQS
ncbi:hypothetical protein N6H18_04525 [Reichenbachiella agarivorans]|uniref:Lipoprotein n=1 Tax=Reichenbachiella agarivorans TaxID=2979464 RepID=A0ABY6CRS5_9BACT|nr:hypothetical protein [Reichenbachiella agarivorans]UXP33217.1 hypothetical protein N6H18_04525 [Reichenbachiella agarivorans]